MTRSPTPRAMQPRMRVAITLGLVLGMLRDVIWPRRQARREAMLAAAVPGAGVVTLSVRSAFAALIEALDLGPGDEIAMSCVTISDMALLPEAYGVRVVPVAVDPHSLAPCPESLEQALSPRTRMFVATHMFGGRADLAECASIVRRHGALLVCDAAQAMGSEADGDRPWRCDTDADVTLLSLGPIKPVTALGGAVAVLRDAALARRMESVQQSWPRRRRRQHLWRIVKYGAFTIIARPIPYGLLLRTLSKRGIDHDAFLKTKTKGFGTIDGAAELRTAVSVRPDAALATTVVRRIHAPTPRACRARRSLGATLTAQLDGRVSGAGSLPHAHWLVPLRCDDDTQRRRLRARLHAAGFDAVPLEETNLVDLSQRSNRPGAARLEHVLLLPSLHGVRARQVLRLLELVRDVLDQRDERFEPGAEPFSAVRAAPRAIPSSA